MALLEAACSIRGTSLAKQDSKQQCNVFLIFPNFILTPALIKKPHTKTAIKNTEKHALTNLLQTVSLKRFRYWHISMLRAERTLFDLLILIPNLISGSDFISWLSKSTTKFTELKSRGKINIFLVLKYYFWLLFHYESLTSLWISDLPVVVICPLLNYCFQSQNIILPSTS